MTIDEAITHAREVAAIQRNNDKLNKTLGKSSPYYNTDCIKCAEEHEQLAEWLEELKAIKSDGFTDDLLNMGFTKGYNKAIDDFVERLTTYLGIENATKYGNKNAEQMRNSYGTFMNYEIAESIEDVAEQLKAGDK